MAYFKERMNQLGGKLNNKKDKNQRIRALIYSFY